MAMRGLTLLLMTFAFYNGAVLGSSDCTIPWLVNKNPFIASIKSSTINRCPTPLIGDQTKEYCCYNEDGVECCNLQEYVVFWFFCLLPFLNIFLIFLIIIKCVSCLCQSCCRTCERRLDGSVLAAPVPINYVYLDPSSVPYQPVNSKCNP